MLWEKPTSASWWTFTVSHTVVISLCSISCGPLHSLRSRVRGIKHTIVVFLFLRVAFPLLVLLHYYSNATKNTSPSLSLSISVSSRSNPVGGATAKNSRCRLWCDPQLQMGWKPSAHTHLVQKGFKHGKKLRAHALHIFLCACAHTVFTGHTFFPSVYKSSRSLKSIILYFQPTSLIFITYMKLGFDLLSIVIWFQFSNFILIYNNEKVLVIFNISNTSIKFFSIWIFENLFVDECLVNY